LYHLNNSSAEREKTMKLKCLVILTVALIVASNRAAAQEPTPPQMPAEELPPGAEALTSGPVHEAFAKPVALEMQAGVIAPRAPPASISEVPPAQRPERANVVWIPGYWAWDDNRSDYIWVSGCWRVPAPGMCWVPGYWAATDRGWEWVAGFWQVGQQEQEIEYLPAPPEPFEFEPLGPASGADVIWVPGCWYWHGGRFIQRHGYWLAAHAGWVWVPSHYSWSPHGYVFCAGHWDYDMDSRGVLFTPVYFPPPVVVRAGFVFSPSICLDLGILRVNFFAYPRYRHYYFGDCYDDSFLHVGIYPWFECERHHTWYDPIFVYDRWHFRKTEPRWEENERHMYEVRRADPARRPPRTFAEQQARHARLPEAQRRNIEMARPLKTFAASRTAPVKWETINNTERRKIAVQSAELQDFRQSRIKWESPAKGAAVVTPTTERRTPKEAAPTEREGPVTSGKSRVPTTKQKAEPPAVRGPTNVPPPEVHVTKPERVKVPPSPIFNKRVQAAATKKSEPTRATEERNQKAPARETPAGKPRGDGKVDGKTDGKGR
jgi:hypothetical protein